MSDLEPGQIFAGRYRIEKFLARGGFGAVYVAEQTETELRVALKVLWPHILGSQSAVEVFKLEARIAGRVSSEHIVKVFDAGFDETAKMPFLVMELLEGQELDKLVESSGPIPPDRLVTYFRQIASALDKAHGYVDRGGAPRPIVHRDLKPENLFLTHRETGEPVVKILDFGIAKVLSDSTKVSQEVKGTPLYMAFEQASAGRITPQTDIWALGLIAFFLLTGRSYWKTANLPEGSLTQLFGEVLTLPIDPPSRRAREMGASVLPNAGFDAWFARCVNRDPAQRFATAGEAAAELAAVFGARSSSGVSSAEAFGATAPAMPGAPRGPTPPAVARATGGTPATLRSGNGVPAHSGVGSTTGGASSLSKTGAPAPANNRIVVMATAGVIGAIAIAGLFISRRPAAIASEPPPSSSVVPAGTAPVVPTATAAPPPPSSAPTTPSASPSIAPTLTAPVPPVAVQIKTHPHVSHETVKEHSGTAAVTTTTPSPPKPPKTDPYGER